MIFYTDATIRSYAKNTAVICNESGGLVNGSQFNIITSNATNNNRWILYDNATGGTDYGLNILKNENGTSNEIMRIFKDAINITCQFVSAFFNFLID